MEQILSDGFLRKKLNKCKYYILKKKYGIFNFAANGFYAISVLEYEIYGCKPFFFLNTKLIFNVEGVSFKANSGFLRLTLRIMKII